MPMQLMARVFMGPSGVWIYAGWPCRRKELVTGVKSRLS